jgi:hypothetical protein
LEVALSNNWKLIKFTTVFAVQVAAVAAVAACNQDLKQNTRIPESGISSHPAVLASAIQRAALYSLGRNNLVPFYESKRLNDGQIYQSETQSLSRALERWVPDWRDANRLPRLPTGLLPIIGGSIATVIVFAGSRARYTSKMEQQQRGLSGFHTSLSTLKALLAGLAATILLSLWELSLRLALH